ncbi:HAD family hydrolase [Micromonospora sp. CPCC 206061]|uniref:HAD family hydrolase n=1 Tax=Micromonospora sp. CPCC 206061 TaxID=3122410 RepID=UPI002FEFCB8B
MTTNAALSRLLAGRGPLLLDFDGPVCSIFAGYPAASVADELRSLLREHGVTITEILLETPDPLDVLRWVGTRRQPEITRLVEDALCEAELHAVRSSAPTMYAKEVIVAARKSGKPIAVVSNNSAGAVMEYLTAKRLAPYITSVIGRAYADPALMKPNPEPILHAVFDLGAEPGECVLVGDSLADITGAQAAGVPIIGYANREEKVQTFKDAKADAVITSMGDIAVALICDDTD